MTKIQLPGLHGSQHAQNGSDPIPGIGGGALEWEDIGAAGAGGGIRFGIQNIGNWLDVETSSYMPSGYGIYLRSQSAIGLDSEHAGIGLHAGNGSIYCTADDFSFMDNGVANNQPADPNCDFQVNVGGVVGLTSPWAQLWFQDGNVQISTLPGNELHLVAQQADISLWATTGDVMIKSISPANPTNAQAVFMITAGTATQEPTYHIRNGATWVADL